MQFAQWLQSKIDEHGFTNYRIAKMAGVHQSTVAGWLAGSRPQLEKEQLVRRAISEYERANGAEDSSPFSTAHYANGISVYQGSDRAIADRLINADKPFKVAYKASGIVITADIGATATSKDIQDVISFFAETKKDLVQTDEAEASLDASLIKRLISLTPDEMKQVDAFVQGILASRST